MAAIDLQGLKRKKFNFDNSILVKKKKKIEELMFSCHAKFHKNPMLNNRVMGLLNLTKLLPFAHSSELTRNIS